MEHNTYRYLQPLSDSDYQIVDGEPNITGWEVKNDTNHYLGKVDDLLFDPDTRAVRYIVVDLTENGMNLADKKVMIPIGIASLHQSEDEVILPNVHIAQFTALPAYEFGKIGVETEMRIRSVIGNPAVLGMEEGEKAFNQNEFYNHHHFDKNRFYNRIKSDDPIANSMSVTGSAVQATGNVNNLSRQGELTDSSANDLSASNSLADEEKDKPWLDYPSDNVNKNGDSEII